MREEGGNACEAGRGVCEREAERKELCIFVCRLSFGVFFFHP